MSGRMTSPGDIVENVLENWRMAMNRKKLDLEETLAQAFNGGRRRTKYDGRSCQCHTQSS